MRTDAGYMRGLLIVLRKRDAFALRQFLKEEASTRNPSMANEIDSISDEDLETRMYKMILARHELSELHGDARRWLEAHDKEVHFG